MIFVGVVSSSILLLIDWRIFESILYYINRHKEREPSSHAMNGRIERDVADEKRKVNSMTKNVLNEYNLVLQDLSKLYRNKYMAVNQISIAIKRFKTNSRLVLTRLNVSVVCIFIELNVSVYLE